MRKSYSKWITVLYGPWFKIIGWFYRSYSANRARVDKLKSNQKLAAFIRYMTIFILLGWLLIWYFAPEQGRIGLLDQIKQSIDGFAPQSE